MKEGAFHISFLNCLLCLGSGVIDFCASRAESNNVCVLRYTSIRSPPRCVARPSLAGLQATSVKSSPSTMLDLSRSLRNLGVFPFRSIIAMGRDSSVGIATRYGLDGPGIESRLGKIFRTRPDRPWGPPSLLYNGYRVFPGE